MASKKDAKAPAKAAAGAQGGNGYVPRLKTRYSEEIVEKLSGEFGIENVMAVPRLEKIVLNMGLGEATQNIKILDTAVEELAQVAGQQPTITRAKKSIAAFKVREGMPIGCRVTLRGNYMWNFPGSSDRNCLASGAGLPRECPTAASMVVATTLWVSEIT